MDPFVSLRLAHPKQVALQHLDRVEPEVEQDEDQLVFDGRQCPLPPSTPPPLAGLCSLRIPPVKVVFIRLTEGWQQFIEHFQCQTRKALEDRGLALELLECDHCLLPACLCLFCRSVLYVR